MPRSPDSRRPFASPPGAPQRDDTSRPNAYQRGYNKRWAKARQTVLSRQPLCVVCQQAGLVTEATEVDHIRPHRGDSNVFWDSGNWQALCKSCHSRKTARGE